MKFPKIYYVLLLSFLLGAERGAELRTRERVLYGKFETRYKPAQGEGLVSSFFIYNDDTPNTPWVEVDIELLGRFPRVVDMNTITNTSHLRTHFNPFNTHLDFFEYGFEWTPDYVAWFINGEEVYRQTADHVADLNHSAKIMMNIWNPIWDDWVGFWDDRVLPRFAYYDWVRYASYTPGNGDTGTNNNFTHQWQDDFNEFDTTRWEKSDNHTWAANQSIFITENAVIDDGRLILCLTDDDNIGYQDQVIPYLLWARAGRDSIVARFSEELDPQTSQMENNYSISGVSVNSATLMDDQRTVILNVSGMLTDNSYNLIVLGIKDDAQPPNTQAIQSLEIDMPQSLSFPLRINNAGGVYNEYLADQLWSSSVEYGHMNGNYQFTEQDISNTNQADLYRSSLNRVVSYKVRVPDGVYSATLKLSENHYDEVAERSFDIFTEDSMWVSELDIYALAGQYSAFDTTLGGIRVEDGILDLYFSAMKYGEGYEYAGPFLNAIVIEQDSLFSLEISPNILPLEDQIHLFQNYPNPFNPSTIFRYSVSSPGETELAVYSVAGQLVSQIINHHSPAGSHQVQWSGGDISSGLYFLRLVHNNAIKTKKILLVK
ncbi:MAG: family 16 glycosylhydrolase [Candidatus Neomarinimicrobiota bacterium]|nr:family 16 glycosylhydrolase [Candidatus Neomarinimicrobiota bacterium]